MAPLYYISDLTMAIHCCLLKKLIHNTVLYLWMNSKRLQTCILMIFQVTNDINGDLTASPMVVSVEQPIVPPSITPNKKAVLFPVPTQEVLSDHSYTKAPIQSKKSKKRCAKVRHEIADFIASELALDRTDLLSLQQQVTLKVKIYEEQHASSIASALLSKEPIRHAVINTLALDCLTKAQAMANWKLGHITKLKQKDLTLTSEHFRCIYS